MPAKKSFMARPAKAEEKKTELMEKAKACFDRYGYSKTTLDDIGREASMNKATLYHYFKNKEELFLQVMLQVATAGLQQLMLKTQKIKTPEKQLVFFFTERMGLYLQLVRLNSLSKESLLQLQGMFDSIYNPEKEKEIEFVSGIIKELLQSGKHAKEYARLLFSVADALKHDALFLGNLLENKNEEVEAVRKKIAGAVQLIIKGFLN